MTTALRALALVLVLGLLVPSPGAAEGCDPTGWKLAFEGDSLTYGQDTRPNVLHLPPINGAAQTRSLTPFPEAVGKALKGAEVSNRGFPGDRTKDAIGRWADARPADIVVIMYGTNDFGNFGGYPDGPQTLEAFDQSLTTLVERRVRQGSKVVLLTPPPIQDPALDQGLELYRATAVSVAGRTGVKVVDTVELLDQLPEKWVDGLHLSSQSNLAIADALVNLLSSQYCRQR